MRRTLLNILIIVAVSAAATFGGCPGQASAAEPVRKVAVVPFTIYAEKDLTFLQKGIVDMLTSRLSQEGEVAVLGREATAAAVSGIDAPLTPQSAVQVGQKLGADYVLYGSLTVFGESVSVDAKMVDVAGSRPPVSFYTQSASFGEVIPAIDRFAAEINEKVFGRTVQPPAAAAAAAPAASASASTAQAAPAAGAPDLRAHPEKLIEGGFGESEMPGAAQPFIDIGSGLRRFWKSRSFPALINGLDLGDVDGDGRLETVLATPDEVLIYRGQDGGFQEIAKIPVSRFKTVIAVDVGDINRNGVEEIFITALNIQRNAPASEVVELNGGKPIRLVDDSRYLFRVCRVPDRGKVLFGQVHRTGADPFQSPIYEMGWNGAEYIEQGQVLPGRKASVLGFTIGSLTESGGESRVVYAPGDYLQLLEPNGSEVWTDTDKTGGSPLYTLLPIEGPGDIENRSYFPIRLRARDFNGDGTDELMTVINHELAAGHLQQFRKFTKSELALYSWDGLGLVLSWHTRELSGYIQDFAIGDFDGDGKDEIVAAIISKDGSLIGTTPKSAVIAFDLKNPAGNP